MNPESETFDFREFLEHFRNMLRAQAPEAENDLFESLLKYGQFCEEANQRLRDCFAPIKRGQYSNAIALSEREPNLLDRCSQLDIPESGVLPAVAQSLGASLPTFSTATWSKHSRTPTRKGARLLRI